jgi:hypothetical protein
MSTWWCERYNKPLKDPLLQQYTLEELMYEYHLFNERALYKEESTQAEADRIEEAKIQEDESWADEMEAMLNAQAQQKAETKEANAEPINPAEDPDNVKWMEEKLKESRPFFGEDFGEDLSLDFNDLDETE